MRLLKQSTSVDVPIGPFLDETDGKTAETALTITQADIRLKKNGGNWAQKNAAQTLSHEENGNYEVTLDATDTNTLGLLRVHVHESGALPVWEDFMVMPANVWDSLFGADALQVHAVEIANGLITAASIAADAITDAKVASDVTIASVTGSVGSVTAGVTLADDAITAAKFDESTAFPLKANDAGATQIARVGSDGDTLETLSDQLDGVTGRLSVLVTKTATVQTDAGNSATQILTDLTETEVDHWRYALVKITSGALAEQVRKCTGYDGAGTLTFTDGFTDVPADGVTIELVND